MLTAILLGLVSCKDDELLVPGDGITDEMRDAYFIIGNQVATRTTHVNDEYTVFDNGDEIGAFALTDDGQNALEGEPKNVCYTVAELSNSEPNDYGYKARVLLPKDNKRKLSKGLTKYLFYYPYNPDIKGLDDLKNLTHKVYADQTEHDNYIKSDLLWDIAFGEDDKCLIMMDHAMANIIISIDGVEYDAEKGAEIIDMPLLAGGVNLTAPNLAEMTAPDGSFAYSNPLELEGQEFSDIKAKQVQYTSSTDKFRAAVPANCTLEGGKDIIRLWTKGKNSQPKVFKLKKDVTLEPGKNYIFTLIKKGQPQPDVTDEDSWVLDVLDPETGDVVGLLCREYIRYQPQNTLVDPGNNDKDNSMNWQPDQITYPYSEMKLSGNGNELKGPTMSSQAWVFYNLDIDGSPNLEEGQILRVIYDVRTKLDGVFTCVSTWPYPYERDEESNDLNGSGQSHSFFVPDHGHNWINDKAGTGYGRSTTDEDKNEVLNGKFKNQNYFEFWDKDESDNKYYTMHGSRIKWCPTHNLIYYFELYGSNNDNEDRVSNQVAKNQGHIAIPTDGGSPYVSFDAIDGSKPTLDIKGNKVCYTMPHYLIDTRINKDNKLEVTRYPLVKIGYNQFWMSQSLHTKYLNDNNKTQLVDYSNDSRHQISDFREGKIAFDEGFVYPLAYTNSSDPQKETWNVDLLYNTIAILDDKFLPKSVIGEDYKVPEVEDMKSLWRYLGWHAFNKIMSSDLILEDGKEAYKLKGGLNAPKTYDEAMARGFSKINNGIFVNISGFNLKASGWCREKGSWPNEGNDNKVLPLLLYPEEKGNNTLFYIHSSKFHGNTAIKEFLNPDQINEGKEGVWRQSCTFAPVRLFISFTSQENKGCACSAHSSLINQAQMAKSPATRSGFVETSVSRNVYVEIVSD